LAKTFHETASSNADTFASALEKLTTLFQSMEEYGLGRVLGTGREVGFQKKHANALSHFSLDLVRNAWRLPLWIFGSHLPGPLPAAKVDTAAASDAGAAPAAQDAVATSAASALQLRSHGLAGNAHDPALTSATQSSTSPAAANVAKDASGNDSHASSVPPGPGSVATAAGASASKPPVSVVAAAPAAENVGDPSHAASETQPNVHPGTSAASAAEDAAADGVQKRRRCVWRCGEPVVERTHTNAAIGNHEEAVKYTRQHFLTLGLHVDVEWKGTETSYYRLDGHCKESAQCPVRFLARIYLSEPPEIEIKMFHGPHQHSRGDAVAYGHIFSAAELVVARRYRETCVGRLSVDGLSSALAHAGKQDFMQLPNYQKSLRQWISRENKKKDREAGAVPVRSALPSVAELECNIDRFRIRTLADIRQQEHDTCLCVLPGSVLTETRGYIPFTCKGMMALLQSYKHEQLILGVDAKVGKGSGAWRIATIGLYVKDELVRSSLRRFDGGRRVRCLSYTTTFRPLLQALMHHESTPNYRDFFNDFLDLCAFVLGISREHFAHTLVSLGKDFCDAAEQARLELLPKARPCGDSTHMFARFALQLPRKCGAAAPSEITAASAQAHDKQISSGMRVVCESAPTIDILDAVLTPLLDHWFPLSSTPGFGVHAVPRSIHVHVYVGLHILHPPLLPTLCFRRAHKHVHVHTNAH
jgi:hypothetical protein